MIEWSENKLKFTSGIGGLCTVGLLAELSRERLPVWIAVAAALIPFLVFLFIRGLARFCSAIDADDFRQDL